MTCRLGNGSVRGIVTFSSVAASEISNAYVCDMSVFYKSLSLYTITCVCKYNIILGNVHV